MRRLVAVLLSVSLAVAAISTVFQFTMIDEFGRSTYALMALERISGNGDTSSIDYTGSEPIDWWGITTNSTWLATYTTRIIPFMEYEGIGYGSVPDAVFFAPMTGDSAFVVLGRAYRDRRAAVINDRVLTIEGWQDDADVLATLVHELIHLQGGDFIGEDSDTFEAFTEAATIEVLAAMCNYGDGLACRSFASSVSDGTASMFIRDADDVGAYAVYHVFAEIFLRDGRQRIRAEKVNRWWGSGRWEERMRLIKRYGTMPLENYVLPGLRGETFRTDLYIQSDGGTYYGGRLSFDDTRVLLNRWGLLELFLSYPVPGKD